MSLSISLRAVAKAAGVSASTASRALSGDRRISSDTRQRVRRLATDLGYVPKPTLSSLAAKRFRQDQHHRLEPLAIITCPDFRGMHQTAALVELCMKRAAELGYCLQEHSLAPSRFVPSAFARIYSTGATGFIFAPMTAVFAASCAEALNRAACISCGWPGFQGPMPAVVVDRQLGLWSLLEDLAARGYQRPGFVLHQHAHPFPTDFLQEGAARQAMLTHFGGIAVPTVPIFKLHGEYTRDRALDIQRWYLDHRPDVVIATHFAVAQHLEEINVRFPQDTGFVSLKKPSRTDRRPHAGFVNPCETVAKQTVERLDSMLRFGQLGLQERGQTLSIMPAFEDGPTLRPRAILVAAPNWRSVDAIGDRPRRSTTAATAIEKVQ